VISEFCVISEGVERIYITVGDSWHRQADHCLYLKDAVAAWLNAPPLAGAPTPAADDRMAGHFVRPRIPVGRYQREGGTSTTWRSARWGNGSTSTEPTLPSSGTPSSCCGGPPFPLARGLSAYA